MPPWMYASKPPCVTCGEVLPHYCTPIITCRRDGITITDRAPDPARRGPGLLVDVCGLLDLCEAADPYESYADRREAILEGGAG